MAFTLALAIAVVVSACGGGTLSALQNLASLPPEATRAPATPSPSPSGPVADVTAHEAAIAAFVDRILAGDMSYRMSFNGRTALAVDVLKVDGKTDVEGSNFATNFTYEHKRLGKVRWQIRAIKGKAWVKATGTGWKAYKGYRDSWTNIPFHAVESVRDVKYVGSELRKGKNVHRIKIPEANLVDVSTWPGSVVAEGTPRTTMELLIDDAGTPIAGTWDFKGRARVGGGQLQEMVYELDLTFSKVDEDLPVTKP
jgi:hypothetical protein